MADFDVRQSDPMQNILLTDGEVLSAGMVRHIWWLRRDAHRIDVIAAHFSTFWNRDITEDSIREVLQNQFVHTDRQPHGYTYITAASIIIPTGIYWFIVAQYNEDTDVTQHDIFRLFKFRMSLREIRATIQQWDDSLPLDENGVPIYPMEHDIVPQHPGLYLDTLAIRPRPDRDHFEIPPPWYSPPFQAGNGGSHHPREVIARGGQMLPFFPPNMEPLPPGFEEGARPPTFIDAITEALFPRTQLADRRQSAPTRNVERTTYQRPNSLGVFPPTMVPIPLQFLITTTSQSPEDQMQAVSPDIPATVVHNQTDVPSETGASISSMEWSPTQSLRFSPPYSPARSAPLDNEDINGLLDNLDVQFHPVGNDLPNDSHSSDSAVTDVIAYQDDDNTDDFLAPIAMAHEAAPVPEARRKRYPDGSVPDPDDDDCDNYSDGDNQDDPYDGDDNRDSHNDPSDGDSSHDGDDDHNRNNVNNGDRHDDSDDDSDGGATFSNWSTQSFGNHEAALIDWYLARNLSDYSDSEFNGDIPYRAPESDEDDSRHPDNAGLTQ